MARERSSASEVEAFTSYLVRMPATEHVANLYDSVIVKRSISSRDKRLLNFMVKRRWSIRYVDSALALTNPESEIRKRMLILFAILESDPHYVDKFLAPKYSAAQLIRIIATGCSAVFSAAIGFLLVRVVK